jgi:hypothetical protein
MSLLLQILALAICIALAFEEAAAAFMDMAASID